MSEDYVKCHTCKTEILDEDAIYVEGKPYCEDCYQEAEIWADTGEGFE